MPMKQKFCPKCNDETLHVQQDVPQVGCLVHVLATVFTFGLWLLIAPLVIALGATAQLSAPYLCQRCGKKNA